MTQMLVMPSPTARSAAGKLLVACARANLDSTKLGEVRSLAGQDDLDWPLTIQIALEHGVLPLLNKAVQGVGAEMIPPEHRQAMRERVQGSTLRNMQLLQQLLKLIADMRAKNVRVLPYKGPTLAMLAYKDLSLRPPGDLDILVPREDLPAARAVLDAHGLKMAHQMDEKAVEEYLDSPHEYDIVYNREADQLCVELHWRISGHFFSFNPDPIGLWDGAAEQKIAGSSVRVFGPEDMLMILCAHGMKHFWTRLTWICDLAQYIRHAPAIDWDGMLERASELEARRMTLLGLLLAHEVLGAAVPAPVIAEARQFVQKQATEIQERLFLETTNPDHAQPGVDWQLTDGGLFESLMFHVKTRETWSSGLRYFFHRGFTPNIVDHSWVKLPRSLSFLYYFVRPIRLFWKYGPMRLISRRRA